MGERGVGEASLPDSNLFQFQSWIMMRQHASYSWSGPQLPKGCGCIGFLSPMHKKIPDSYSKREGGNPGNSGLLSQQ